MLVFTPEPAFLDTATPVSYRVDTAAGDAVQSTATPTVTAAPVLPPTPIETLPDVVVTAPAGAPAVFDLPAVVPDLVPESVALILPKDTPAAEFATDDGTWQVQPTTGQVVFKPSPTLVGDPDPITFAAERTDGPAVTGRLVVDYVASATAPAASPAPAAGVGAAASSKALAFTGSDAGTTSAAALIGATILLVGVGLTTAGRRRLPRWTWIRNMLGFRAPKSRQGPTTEALWVTTNGRSTRILLVAAVLWV